MVLDDRRPGHRGISLGDKIHRHKEEDEKARKARKEAYDAGLIGLREVNHGWGCECGSKDNAGG